MSRRMADSVLFQPWNSPWGHFRNRIVMAPMTRHHSPGGVPGDEVAAYYARRAAGGVGLIVTEGTTVDDAAASSAPDTPRFHGDDALAGWRKVVEAVHAEGGRIVPQLWHVGTTRKPGSQPHPEAPSLGPSGLFKPGVPNGRAMDQSDIDRVVTGFGKAAREARRLGFDGVELHGAHGYLIDEFFWEGTNLRSDRYGGSLEKRTRFAVEVVESVRQAVGPDFLVILRFSQWKQQDFGARLARTPAELERFLAPLCAAGVDVFHASTRRFWEPEFEGSDLNLAGWTRKLSGRPAISVGSVGLDTEFIATMGGAEAGVNGSRIGELIERLERGEFELVAVGRCLLVDPFWVEKLHDERWEEIQPYTREAAATYY